MIAYVMLIVIAVGLSAGVYTFLKVFVPKDTFQCQEDVQMIIQAASCTAQANGKYLVSVELANRGYFYVPDVFIRFGISGKEVRSQLNPDQTSLALSGTSGLNCPKALSTDPCTDKGLKPGQSFSVNLADVSASAGSYVVEIQPAVRSDKGVLAICPSAVTTQAVECK